MDPERKRRIKESFNFIAKHDQALTDLVYEKLFSLCPHARKLFPDDMTVQKMQMSIALELIVKSLDNTTALEEYLKDMGDEHEGHGVKPEYYPLMGRALLSAMAEVSGPEWTPQLEEDWSIAINDIAKSMLKGAKSSDQSREAA